MDSIHGGAACLQKQTMFVAYLTDIQTLYVSNSVNVNNSKQPTVFDQFIRVEHNSIVFKNGFKSGI